MLVTQVSFGSATISSELKISNKKWKRVNYFYNIIIFPLPLCDTLHRRIQSTVLKLSIPLWLCSQSKKKIIQALHFGNKVKTNKVQKRWWVDEWVHLQHMVTKVIKAKATFMVRGEMVSLHLMCTSLKNRQTGRWCEERAGENYKHIRNLLDKPQK